MPQAPRTSWGPPGTPWDPPAPCWKTPPNVGQIFLGKALGDAGGRVCELSFVPLHILGCCFSSLGPSLDVIERPWKDAGGVLGVPGVSLNVLRSLWKLLEAPWGFLWGSWRSLGGPLGVLGRSLGGPWEALGNPWGLLGRPLRVPGGSLEGPWGSWGVLGVL